MEPKTFIFNHGYTCAGKDTQAEREVLALGDKTDQISTGDIGRRARAREKGYEKFYDRLEPYFPLIDSGGLYPDEVIVPIVGEVIEDRYVNEGKRFFVFTGFPRTLKQLELVDKMTEGEKTIHILHKVSKGTARSRAQVRVLKADRDGKSIRPEDTGNAFGKKLETYDEKTNPMIVKLAREGRLYIVDAEGRRRDDAEGEKDDTELQISYVIGFERVLG